MPVRAVAVFAPCDPDDSMPSKDVVRQAQRKARAADGADVPAFDAVVGRAVLDDEGLFRVLVRGRNVLWIPDSDQQLQVRLMICAHMRDAGHRGVAATLVRLQEFCVWSGMESHVRDFVGQCLHCADTRSGDVVPRPLGETVHGTAPNEVVHFRLLVCGPEWSTSVPRFIRGGWLSVHPGHHGRPQQLRMFGACRGVYR